MKYAYTFDQLRRGSEEAEDRLFISYDRQMGKYGRINLGLYFGADSGLIEAPDAREACERLFYAYNMGERPDGYTGRSMSVSDVVHVWEDGADHPVKTTWFCDSVGFRLIAVSGKPLYDRDAFSFRQLEIGDYVTEDVVDDLMDMLPPACMRSDCSQVGEPDTLRWDEQRHGYRATYSTFRHAGSVCGAPVWQFCGDRFRGENVQRGEEPPYVTG